PFSARWEGTLYVPSDGAYQFWLTASGPGALRIDGQQVASVDADGRETVSATLELTRGSHPIRVQYARRPPRSPDMKVEWNVHGRRTALAIPYLFLNEVTPAAWERDRTVLAASQVTDGIFLVLAGAGLLVLAVVTVGRVVKDHAATWALVERVVLGAFVAAVFLSASVTRLDRVDKLELLGGGQDWLTHESFARDILIGGPLMTLGKPLGEGRTFYAQPFYPYALAAMHALTGEDQFGVLAIQVLGSGLVGVLLFYLAKRLFGTAAAWATFGLFLPLWSWHLEWVSYRLISEAVYFVILPALLLVLVRCLDERRPLDFVLAGLLLGLAVVTRGPTLLYVPFVGAILWWGLRRANEQRATVVRQLAVLLLAAGLIVGLVPLRNAIVAGQPALLASSGGVNLQKLHRPSNGVRLNQAQDRWFAEYIQDAPTRETVEFVLQDPVGYVYACLLLAAYTLGYGAAVEESGVTVWPELIALNLLYLGAIFFLAGARTLRAGLLHAFVLIHFATMVIFVPYDYDNRLVLPMYLPIVVFGGYAVAELLTRAVERVRADAPARPVLAERPRS
ncbi:MAG TPA: PA14 domain-containing protein, partial [Chloroflexota bacterium]|nr:PA14 domain-containing protein [Chloroflexota bacterium]